MAKSKYFTHVEPKLTLIEGWARDGLTDEQIANNLGVAVSTFNEYKNKYPKFSESLKRGKEVIDYEVENALLKRALGYEYEEIKSEYECGELIKTTRTIKHVVPDTTAQIFWLKNRKPQQWREKKDIEHSGQINNPYAELTKEQLLKLVSDEDG
ncbi:transposase [Terrisporobacter vanillatitrophus]|uniref:transposase n=1 Tax=Terrisporobacter vanillatitrophus TaxID=3058402 RepID=UPI003EBED37A